MGFFNIINYSRGGGLRNRRMKRIIIFLIMLIAFSSFTYSVCDTTTLTSDNLLYYKLEENGATPYIDEVGNLGITLGNLPTRTTGIIDYGQDFEADNTDYLATASTTIFDVPNFTWNM